MKKDSKTFFNRSTGESTLMPQLRNKSKYFKTKSFGARVGTSVGASPSAAGSISIGEAEPRLSRGGEGGKATVACEASGEEDEEEDVERGVAESSRLAGCVLVARKTFGA